MRLVRVLCAAAPLAGLTLAPLGTRLLQSSGPLRTATGVATRGGWMASGSGGALPFIGPRTMSSLLTALGMVALGAAVFALARWTRTPSPPRAVPGLPPAGEPRNADLRPRSRQAA